MRRAPRPAHARVRPPPITRTFTVCLDPACPGSFGRRRSLSPCNDPARLLSTRRRGLRPEITELGQPAMPADARTNLAEFTVSELAFRRSSAPLRTSSATSACAAKSPAFAAAFLRPCLFHLKDESALHRRRGLAGHAARACAFKPEEGLEVIATGRSPPSRAASQIPDRHRADRAGRRRRAHGAARGAARSPRRRGPVRRGAQEAAALSAARHRRRHLAHGRGDPRHPAPARRPLPAPRAGLAGAGAGRDLRRRGRGRPSPASTRCPRAARFRVPTCSSSRAAAARSRTCGASTRRSWCAPPRRAPSR